MLFSLLLILRSIGRRRVGRVVRVARGLSFSVVATSKSRVRLSTALFAVCAKDNELPLVFCFSLFVFRLQDVGEGR